MEVAMSHTILVVDDEADIRAFLTAVLEKEGHRVVTAPDGRQALRIAEEEQPDLIILDLQMPEATGTDFYRRLTKDEALRNTPIIVVSGVPGRHLAVTRPFAVFEKPIVPDEFAATVERALAESHD
jgi:two-component system, cell cycle response regulator DivK